MAALVRGLRGTLGDAVSDGVLAALGATVARTWTMTMDPETAAQATLALFTDSDARSRQAVLARCARYTDLTTRPLLRRYLFVFVADRR